MNVLIYFTILGLTSAVPSDRALRAIECGSQLFLTDNNGQFSSHTGMNNGHNYGKNLNCIWRVQGPELVLIELVATSFDLEADPSCSYDYVELFDGDSINAPSLGKFCGRVFKPITSTQRYMTINFVTDDNDQHSGFTFFYNFTTTSIHQCLNDQFLCSNNRCIDNTYKCDGDDDCLDDSDEQNCPAGGGGGGTGTGRCEADEFKCNNGNCIDKDWLCDLDDDCGDGTDENRPHCPIFGK